MKKYEVLFPNDLGRKDFPLWIKFALLFIRRQRVETPDGTVDAKKFRGKTYIVGYTPKK
jgi:hypothetical protein